MLPKGVMFVLKILQKVRKEKHYYVHALLWWYTAFVNFDKNYNQSSEQNEMKLFYEFLHLGYTSLFAQLFQKNSTHNLDTMIALSQLPYKYPILVNYCQQK